MCVKSLGLAPGLANARPLGSAQNLQMSHPQDWQGGQMPQSSRGEGGGGRGEGRSWNWLIYNDIHLLEVTMKFFTEDKLTNDWNDPLALLLKAYSVTTGSLIDLDKSRKDLSRPSTR